MKLLFALAGVAGAAWMTATPAFADSVRSCAELTNPQSPNFEANRDTWWRYTDERGMSCAQGDLAMSDDGAGIGDDDDDDAGTSAQADAAHAKDGKTKTP